MHMLRLAVAAVAVGTLAAASFLVWDRRYRGTRGEDPAFRQTAEVFRDPTTGRWTRVYEDPATGRRQYRPDAGPRRGPGS